MLPARPQRQMWLEGYTVDWNIQNDELHIIPADTPIPKEKISDDRLSLLTAASAKLTDDC